MFYKKSLLSLSILVIAAIVLAACAPAAAPEQAPEPTPMPLEETEEEPMEEPEEEAMPESLGTVVDIAVADGRFETLVTAVPEAGLAATLSRDGPFTVFAPTDIRKTAGRHSRSPLRGHSCAD